MDQWEPTLGAKTCKQLKASMIKILVDHPKETMFETIKEVIYQILSDFEPVSLSFFNILGAEIRKFDVRFSISVNPAQFFSAVSLTGRATVGLITQAGESLRNTLR